MFLSLIHVIYGRSQRNSDMRYFKVRVWVTNSGAPSGEEAHEPRGAPSQPVSPDPRPVPAAPAAWPWSRDLLHGHQEQLDTGWSLSDPRLDPRPPGLTWREPLGCLAPGLLRGLGIGSLHVVPADASGHPL